MALASSAELGAPDRERAGHHCCAMHHRRPRSDDVGGRGAHRGTARRRSLLMVLAHDPIGICEVVVILVSLAFYCWWFSPRQRRKRLRDLARDRARLRRAFIEPKESTGPGVVASVANDQKANLCLKRTRRHCDACWKSASRPRRLRRSSSVVRVASTVPSNQHQGCSMRNKSAPGSTRS